MNYKVVGIGNPIMKDDGIGVYITEKFKDLIKLDNVEIYIGETDAEMCLSKIEKDDFLIIIDGTLLGLEPGTINQYPLNSITDIYKSYSQHDMSLLYLLTRYGYQNDGYIIGIEVDEVDFGTELSEVLQSNINIILDKVKRIIIETLEVRRDA